jgi:protein-disulfide isomerase
MPRLLMTVAALLALTAAAPRAVDWTRTVTRAPNGAFIVGKPAAPTKIVEYVSYTCSHCAAFMAEGMPVLKSRWVRTGHATIEVRNAVRDRYDLTAALLARCGGPERFFGNHEALYANFQAWMPKVQAYDEANRDKPIGTDEVAAMQSVADGTGLTALMAKRGVTPARQRVCLADKAAMQAVLGMTREAWEERKIPGTPSFLVNGELVPDAHGWTALSAALPAPPK